MVPGAIVGTGLYNELNKPPLQLEEKTRSKIKSEIVIRAMKKSYEGGERVGNGLVV